eukprot:TRINITY_DN20037_c0_g1_i1.p1 TRINITY_DN20037_c0_g1~~TRINITY_DN20037_c0_g1_i1.p1  ORF type:complete len:242 (+),score=28.29 TRINITY_DN20037_c0_g1_i1:216-941(+)
MHDSEWGAFGNWSDCETYLDPNNTHHYKHIRFRTRECECPRKGVQCQGSSIEIEECDTDCTAIWTPWCPWSRCIVQTFDCIDDMSGDGVCHGFRFRTRACLKHLPNNKDECDGNCTCEADVFGAVAKQTKPCMLKNCLQIKFDNDGNDKCRPQWRFEFDNDKNTKIDNALSQQGGYLGDDCIPVIAKVNYLLIIERGCGSVSWHYRGKALDSFEFEHPFTSTQAAQDYQHKTISIVIPTTI